MNLITTAIYDGEAMKSIQNPERKISGVMRLTTMLTMGAFLMQACGGDGTRGGTPVASTPTTPAGSAPTSIATPDQAAVVNVSVSLPTGTPQSLATLALNNSIGAVSVGAAGTFALPVFAGGPQYADLLDQDGTVVAAGFVSPAAASIDATSTAKALIYFAGGFYALPLPYRVDIVDQISTVDGFGDVVTAVSNAMIAGGVGSKTGGPLVAAALQTFVTALYAPSNAAPAAVMARQKRTQVKDVQVTPSDLQSGITVINDFPDGVHFMNKYRRLATAYIDEVSYSDTDGTVHPKAVTNVVSPTQIASTSGLGNVTSTAVDAARVLAGAGGDYNPVSTSSVPLALESGSAKTTYNVTVVGPGVHFGTVAMTDQQTSQQRKLVLQQLLQNYVVPLTCSVIIPISASNIDKFFNDPAANAAIADLIGNLGVAAPQIYDLMNDGNVADAMTAAFNALTQSNEVQRSLLALVQSLVNYAATTAVAETAAARGTQLLLFLNVLSGALVSYDVGVLTTQLALSNRADLFTVNVIPAKVTLTPQTATIPTTISQTFVAAVPQASDSGKTVVYTWSNTAVNGHLSDGMKGHLDDFDSSRNTVTYTPNSTGAGDDTITVIAYLVDNSNREPIGLTESTVTVQSEVTAVGITPQNPQVLPGTLQNFVVKGSAGAFADGTTFKWVLTGGFDLFGGARDLGGSGGGTIGVNISPPASNGASTGTSVTVTTSTPNITFAANPFGPEAYGPDFAWIDLLTLTVSVIDSGGNVLETATTLIGTQIPRDILLP